MQTTIEINLILLVSRFHSETTAIVMAFIKIQIFRGIQNNTFMDLYMSGMKRGGTIRDILCRDRYRVCKPK